MMDQALLSELRKRGIEAGEHVEAWLEAIESLAALDAIARAGGHALVKVDGGRDGRNVYTVVVSGGRLGEEFFRNDGPNLAQLLSEAIAFFLARAALGGASPI